MRKLLRPRLINGSFGDPLIYCSIAYVGRAFCFDMGASFDLSNKELMRVDSVYLSHAHMDHIFGFDHFLRANLKQHRTIEIFGPKDIQKNIQGKLKGFTWNLVSKYGLEFLIHELRGDEKITHQVISSQRFSMREIGRKPLRGKLTYPVQKNEYYSVTSAPLDHRITSQAYSVTENTSVTVNKQALDAAEMLPGPWLQQLKQLAVQGKPTEKTLSVPLASGEHVDKTATQLINELILPSRQSRITYVTDAADTPDNCKRILKLADGSDTFFCEAPFLEKDRDKATLTHHMTAARTGELAKQAGAKRLVIFHFSKKYVHKPQPLIDEASEAFGKKVEYTFSSLGHYDYQQLPSKL